MPVLLNVHEYELETNELENRWNTLGLLKRQIRSLSYWNTFKLILQIILIKWDLLDQKGLQHWTDACSPSCIFHEVFVRKQMKSKRCLYWMFFYLILYGTAFKNYNYPQLQQCCCMQIIAVIFLLLAITITSVLRLVGNWSGCDSNRTSAACSLKERNIPPCKLWRYANSVLNN